MEVEESEKENKATAFEDKNMDAEQPKEVVKKELTVKITPMAHLYVL